MQASTSSSTRSSLRPFNPLEAVHPTHPTTYHPHQGLFLKNKKRTIQPHTIEYLCDSHCLRSVFDKVNHQVELICRTTACQLTELFLK